jgi:hypothetical protein
MKFIYIIVIINLFSCQAQLDNYKQFHNQKIELRDSLFVLHTVKIWGEKNWHTWNDYSKLYSISKNDVEYFIGGTFYSPDKKKMIVWVGEKLYNAKSLEMTRGVEGLNKICPNGGDTIYNLSALIGIREDINQSWKLYPFDQQNAVCFDTKEEAINVLNQYYFTQMKTHQMYKMMQNGRKKGHKILQAYGFNIQDKEFWDKCWLFQKDTVGSYGLYPFQLKGYDYYGERCTQKCGEEFILPYIEYPKHILELYK